MPSGWLNKMLNHEVTPPENAWANITNELDKEDENAVEIFKQKMLSHEQTPPAAVLGKIFDQLKSDAHPFIPDYAEKLKNHSENPPAETWHNIAAKLNAEELKIIPLHPTKKHTRTLFLKVAAAAAVIAFFIIAILPTAKQNHQGSETVAVVMPKSEPAQMSPANHTADTQITNSVSVVNQIKNSDNGTHNTFHPAPNYVKSNAAFELAQDPSLDNKQKLQNNKGETPMDIALLNTPNTYISITGADGQSVKVSSKFSNLLGYLNQDNQENRENIDVIIEESAKWKKIFAAWRDKMTNNAVAPSFTNFMDIIELSKVVEGKDN